MLCGRTGQTRTDTPFRASGPKPEAATNYATVPHIYCLGASGPVRTGYPELRRFVLFPNELQTQILVPPERLELPTPSFVGKCSDPLS